MTTDRGWLALTEETVVEPELPIIDPHHHLWDRPGNRYLLDDLQEDAETHDVRQTVFIECGSMYREDGPNDLEAVGETEFVEGVAEDSLARANQLRACTGIVGSADLTLGREVGRGLDAHVAASPERFRGIRHRAAWDASEEVSPARAKATPGLLVDDAFREGFRELATRGLSFEAWLFHPQIPELVDLAGAFPDATIIVNHLAGPLGVGPYAGRRAEVFAQWKAGISELAQHPNLVMKVGGIQMPVNGFGWHERPRPPTSDELIAVNRDWYLHAIDAFGPGRCMFESNFPVDKQSCSYTVLWNQFKKLTAGFSKADRAALFHDTALRTYRLEAS